MAAEGDFGKKSTFKGTRLLSVALPVVALGLGSLMGYQAGVMDSAPMSVPRSSTPATRSISIQMPELVISLDAPSDAPVYMRLVAALEMPAATSKTTIDKSLPQLIDGFQIYLRALRPEEVRGAPGTTRIKEELLRRANRILTPVRVQSVLIQEMIVQ